MAVHVDLLARLHRLLGAFAILAGVSLLVLAAGAAASLVDLPWAGPAAAAGAVLLAVVGGVTTAAGAGLVATGRGLARRRPTGRTAALALAVPTLAVVPFGTALGIYTFWVLLNDEARRAFGQTTRAAT